MASTSDRLRTPKTAHDRRHRAFRHADEFAVDAYRSARTVEAGDGADLAAEIRRSVARCGGAMVAASGAERGGIAERERLGEARDLLLEVRYYLYLARRLGLLELRRYRRLTARQDSALAEIEALIRGGSRPP